MASHEFNAGYRVGIEDVMRDLKRGVRLIEIGEGLYIPQFWGQNGPGLRYDMAKAVALAVVNGCVDFE